jgi:hypothetical protein
VSPCKNQRLSMGGWRWNENAGSNLIPLIIYMTL